jgi:hypothetical protein
MAITSTEIDKNVWGNKYAKTFSFTLTNVSEGEISCGFKKVTTAFCTNGDVNIIINSNDGTANSDYGDIYLVGAQNSTGHVTVIGL